MRVSVITPSSGNEACLELCQQLVQEQTIQVHEHNYVASANWQANVTVLLEACEGDFIALWDDDDWYDPRYLETCLSLMTEDIKVVGQSVRRWYHLGKRAYNNDRESGPLPGTFMFHRSLIEPLQRAMAQGVAYKDFFWQHQGYDGPRYKLATDFIVQMKGTPGKRISVKHEYTKDRFPNLDRDAETLQRWVGKDWAKKFLELVE